MRRTCVFCWIISILLFFSAGCTTNTVSTPPETTPSYEAFIISSSDSTDGVHIAQEYELVDESVYSEAPPADLYELTFKGYTYSAELMMVTTHEQCTYPEYMYSIVSGGRGHFYIDPYGNLTAFFNDDLSVFAEVTQQIPLEECIASAVEYMREIKDISDFQVTVEDETDRDYFIVFRRYVDGIATKECVRIGVLKDGRIAYFRSVMLDRLPQNLSVAGISMDAVHDALNAKLEQIFPAPEAQNAEYVFQLNHTHLTVLNDGRRAFISSVTVQLKRYSEDGTCSVTSQVLKAVIPVD